MFRIYLVFWVIASSYHNNIESFRLASFSFFLSKRVNSRDAQSAPKPFTTGFLEVKA